MVEERLLIDSNTKLAPHKDTIIKMKVYVITK